MIRIVKYIGGIFDKWVTALVPAVNFVSCPACNAFVENF